MLLAVSMMFLRFLYPDRNIQCRGFDSHLSVFVDNVCRCCRDGVVPAFRWKRPAMSETVDEDEDGSNPLEFKVALIFAVLFVIKQSLPIIR